MIMGHIKIFTILFGVLSLCSGTSFSRRNHQHVLGARAVTARVTWTVFRCTFEVSPWSQCINGVQSRSLTPLPGNPFWCGSGTRYQERACVASTTTTAPPTTTPAAPAAPTTTPAAPTTTTAPPTTTPAAPTTTPAPTTQPPVPSTCGQSTVNPATEPLRAFTDPQYIVGGFNAEEGEYPWMAWLQIGGVLCGGSLISDRYVLTAAHCIRGRSAFFTTVNLGEYNRNVNSANQIAVGATRLIVHPDYNRFTYENDIGLIEMASSVTFTNYIQPICIPSFNQGWPTGERCTVSGWGTTSESGSTATILQEVEVSLWNYQACLDTFPNNADSGLVHTTTVCAGEERGGKDSCQGDSGGPLMCRSSGSWFVTGIVSTGIGCARDGYPGVYTNVANFTNWINTYTNAV